VALRLVAGVVGLERQVADDVDDPVDALDTARQRRHQRRGHVRG
jgi:hypothetical protein